MYRIIVIFIFSLLAAKRIIFGALSLYLTPTFCLTSSAAWVLCHEALYSEMSKIKIRLPKQGDLENQDQDQLFCTVLNRNGFTS